MMQDSYSAICRQRAASCGGVNASCSFVQFQKNLSVFGALCYNERQQHSYFTLKVPNVGGSAARRAGLTFRHNFTNERNLLMNKNLFKNGVSGSTLKLFAIFTMLIDHIGAVVILQLIRSLGGGPSMTVEAYTAFMAQYGWLVTVYDVIRGIGRVAFPIFCFLLVESFLHTKHLFRYIRNLALFALLSEPCFDLAFHNVILEFTYQNVFFTLLTGLIVLCVIREIEDRLPQLHFILAWLLKLAVIGLGCWCAELLQSDYGAYGVLCISLMYLFRAHKPLAFGAGCAPLIYMSFSEAIALADLPLILAYNGKRGLSMKYFFYAFYPVHLLLLHLVCVLLL